jgi:hypothetical protein
VKLVILAVLALACGAGAVRYYRTPRERPLLDRAVRVAALSSAFPQYWWLSEHEALVIRDTSGGDWALERLNIDTGKSRPAERLSALFRKTGGQPDSTQVASDGSHILWTGAKSRTFVATTAGSKISESVSSAESVKLWLNDCFRWVELTHNEEVFTGAIVRSTLDPKSMQRRPLTPTISCLAKDVDLSRLTPTTDDHILATLWSGRERGIKPALIVAMVMHAQINMVGKFKLTPPRNAETGELIFAPIFGRLAWVVDYKPEWSPFTRQSSRTGLWVSRMRDWRIHEVGSLEAADGSPELRLRGVQWSPDGMRLSFVHKNSLWIVDADG